MKLKHLCITMTLVLPWLWNSMPLPAAQAADRLVAPAVAPGQAPEGLSTAEWGAIREQVRQAEYHYTWYEPSTAYVAPNRVQGWHTALGADGLHMRPGVDPAEAGWELQLRLSAWGYATQLQPVTGEPVQRAEDGRVTYQWHAALTEWYVNSERGLEQGFTLARPPTPSQAWERLPAQRVGTSENLVLEMALTTDLHPSLTADGHAVLFGDDKGQAVLRYADLHVADAEGVALPARLELGMERAIPHSTLRIVVDDRRARYPLTVNPLFASEVVKLIASDGGAGDVLGQPMSIDGDTLVVGAHRADVGGNGGQGAAYVFYRNEGGADNWGQVVKLTADDGAAGDYFGNGVSISGDTIVIGAYLDNGYRGSAYVFYRNRGGADNWGQVKKLTASDGSMGDWFGLDVSVDGDTIVIGARYAEGNRGAIYVFYRHEGGADNWGQIKKLTASDGAAGDIFGSRVSLNGDTLVAGAPWADVDGRSDQGKAYVFYRNWGGANTWGQVVKLTADDGTAGDQFGNQVSLSGDTLVVSAPHAAASGNNNVGTAYVFFRDQDGANTWGQVEKLIPADGSEDDNFGVSVSISGDTVAVGARYADVNGNDDQGATYVFYRDQGGPSNWGQVVKLTASDGEAGDWFGQSVSVSGNTVVVGAAHANIDGNVDQGAAYVYHLTYQSWLPLVMRNYKPPIGFPLHIGDPILTRPVDHQGEIFYTKALRIPGELPTGGNFYFSSQPGIVAPVLVDDELALLSGGIVVYSYNFSSGGSPTPAILEVPRSMLEQLAGKIVTIEYRDVYGSVVEASDMWLIWTP